MLKAVLKLDIKGQRHYRTLHYSLEHSVPAESASEGVLVYSNMQSRDEIF